VSEARLAGHPLRLGPRRWSTIWGTLPGVALAMLHSSVLDLPRTDFIDALHADRYRIYWIIGSYLVGAATGMASTSLFASRHGLRRAYLGALAVFTVASTSCVFASTVEGMVLPRLVSGYAMGLMISSAMLLLWREFADDRELAMTLYGMGVYLSSLVGAVIGGLLLFEFPWRTIFALDLPLGLAAWLASRRLLPEDAHAGHAVPDGSGARLAEHARFDLFGFAVFAIWVVSMVVVLAFGQWWGWFDSPSFVPWFVICAVSFLSFVAWGLASPAPLIDLRPLGERNFGLGLTLKALFSIDFFVVLSLLSGYMIDLRGYQWWQGGAVLLCGAATMLAAMLASARFGRDETRKLRMFLGMALMAAMTWRISAVDLYTSKLWLAGALAIWGVGAGAAIGPIMLTTFAGVPPSTLLRAAGVFNIFRSLPVFAVGSMLLVFFTWQTDGHFDRLRLRITYNRPLVEETLQRTARHATERGSPIGVDAKRAHAVLTGWVHRNARAFALEDVLRVLSLLTATSLLLIPLLRPPPAENV